jgi:hypothetical protein
MIPGHYLPNHRDPYSFYKQSNNINDVNQIKRYVIFLEDWADGHYLTIGDRVITNWSAGDVAGWSGEQLHSAINLGTINRYTLQLTGITK